MPVTGSHVDMQSFPDPPTLKFGTLDAPAHSIPALEIAIPSGGDSIARWGRVGWCKSGTNAASIPSVFH
eukprot:364429-Chlamydomonas_euryale.AAC.12